MEPSKIASETCKKTNDQKDRSCSKPNFSVEKFVFDNSVKPSKLVVEEYTDSLCVTPHAEIPSGFTSVNPSATKEF